MSGHPHAWSADDLATLAKMSEAGATAIAMAAAVGRAPASIYELRRQGRIQFANAKRPNVIPDDFETRWQSMSQAALSKHYGRGPNTVAQWIKDLGLQRSFKWRSEQFRAKPKPAPAPKPVKAKRLPDVTPIGRAANTAPVDTYQRDMSPAGQAADYLRQFGPVYRCNVTGRAVDAIVAGRANPEATHWRVGSAVVTSNELIDRAASKRRREAERRAA